MRIKRKEYATREEKRTDFVRGAGLFWLINILLLGLLVTLQDAALTGRPLGSAPPIVGTLLNLIPWVVNLGFLLFAALTRPPMALGYLAGFGVLLALVAVLFAVVWATCYLGGYL